MVKKHTKRVNPRKIPVSANMKDVDRILAEAGKDNLYFAWLLVMSNLMDQEQEDAPVIAELWESVKTYNETHREIKWVDIHRAEQLFGFCIPCRNVRLETIRNAAELESVRSRLRKNSVAVAICALLLGIKHSGYYSDAELKRLYLNVELTLAEIENGSNTYKKLLKEVERRGIRLIRSSNSGEMITIELTQEDNQKTGRAEPWRIPSSASAC